MDLKDDLNKQITDLQNEQIKAGIESVLAPFENEMNAENVIYELIKSEAGYYRHVKLSDNASAELNDRIQQAIKSIVWKYSM
jgi:hypothetical protein